MTSSRDHRYPEVKNVKCHFRIPSFDLPVIDLLFRRRAYKDGGILRPVKITNNFAVLRNRYVYTIFTSGFVNVTKINCECKVQLAVTHLEELLQICTGLEDNPAVIDNIQASGNFFRYVNLLKFKRYVKQITDIRVSYNPEHFPGLNLKFGNRGTILIFTSGKYSIVGAKSMDDCDKIYVAAKILLDLYDNYSHLLDPDLTPEIELELRASFLREVPNGAAAFEN